MYQNKKILLIAGGGTLGTYVSRELLRQGASVDVICLEDRISDNERLRFFKERITPDNLAAFLEGRHYDGAVNFIHFPDAQTYPAFHRILIKHTDHLIFLSSYRIYADLQHPITESAPWLLNVSRDEKFLAEETYALSKAKCENFLRAEAADDPWTIVRPVISFSKRRFDLFTHSGRVVLDRAAAGIPLELPNVAKDLHAGLDWSGNSGKLIANLLLRPGVIGEAYTISSGPNLTWGQVAQAYTERIGLQIKWVEPEEYAALYHTDSRRSWHYWYDRLFDRQVDVSKVLAATGLTASDFRSIPEGISIELERLKTEGAD